jgi:hypothetical protein
MANTNPPPPANQQSEKHRGFGEDIGQLSLCVNVSHLNVSLLYMISQEVVFPLKVSHSLVEEIIFCYRDGTSVIIIRRTLSKLTLKSLMVYIIHRIWEQQLPI